MLLNSRTRPAITGEMAPKMAGPVNMRAVAEASVPRGTASSVAASITGLIEYKNIPSKARIIVNGRPLLRGSRARTRRAIAASPIETIGRRLILSDNQPKRGAVPTPKGEQ